MVGYTGFCLRKGTTMTRGLIDQDIVAILIGGLSMLVLRHTKVMLNDSACLGGHKSSLKGKFSFLGLVTSTYPVLNISYCNKQTPR